MVEASDREKNLPVNGTIRAGRVPLVLEGASFLLFMVALAWAPFPLGSNRPWSWSLLCLLIATCWLLWSASVCARPGTAIRPARALRGPAVLVGLALAWGVVQIVPWVPRTWPHPIWQIASTVLGRDTGATISLDPWRTETALMKCASYAMAAALAYQFARRGDRAGRLLDALIAIGGVYAAYALVMAALGLSQFALFYGGAAATHDISGPFVNRNNYATFAGIVTLCAGVRLIERGRQSVVSSRGARPFFLTLFQYLLGRGLFFLIAAALALSSVIATGSRAGTFATLVAIIALLFMAKLLNDRRGRKSRTAIVGAGILVAIIALFAINGHPLLSRLDDMAISGGQVDVRLQLWNAALRMIGNAPFLGLGLGTYQSAYPMYSDTMLPFIMDRAHNDYLELAAGWGLPAALCWWGALFWLTFLCLRGVFQRRRNRAYPLLAVGTGILVGVHSIFDFSLQMPAIAVTYASILGLGVAQAFPTRPAA